MKSQKDKGILDIKYNYLDLPDYITFDKTYVPRFQTFPGDYNVNTQYLYRADGTKLKKIYTYGVGKANTEESTVTDYLDGFQYETVDSGNLSAAVLKFLPTAEGYYNFENNKYIYSYTDHLGNIRLSYFNNGSGAEVLEENNYYPFGLKHEGYNPTAGNNAYQYKYNGKELQTESGIYAMDWRSYMPELGRFSGMDVLSESYNDSTPYHFALNNPVFYSDPTGMYTNTHNGYLFTNTDEIAALQKYFGESGGSVSSLGGFMSGNETFKEDIPGIVIPAFKGFSTHYGWGDAVQNHFNSYMNSWNTSNFNNFINSVMNQIQNSTSGNYVRAAPDNPFANPSSQLAYNGLIAMQMSASGIATEFVAARTGLTFLSAFGGQGVSLSTTGSVAENTLGSIGVQTSFPLGTTKVGHWSPLTSYNQMVSTGLTVTEQGGMTFFSTNGPNGWTAAPSGWVYSEMEIPSASLIPGGQANWLKAVHPEAGASQRFLIQKQGGMLTPPVFNISKPLIVK